MIYATIIQYGNDLEIDNKKFPAQFSKDIPIKFIKDEKYRDYTVIPYFAVGKYPTLSLVQDVQKYTCPLNTDNVFILPKEAFELGEYLYIAFTLSNGEESQVTKPIVINLDRSLGDKNAVLPENSEILQQLVTSLASQLVDTRFTNTWDIRMTELKNEVDNAVDTIHQRLENGSFIGPQGPRGDIGPQGPRGDIGPQGPTGGAIINNGEITAVKLDSSVIDLIVPVGIIREFGLDKNPNTIYPGTTWARFAEGRTTVGYQSSDVDFNTIGKVGGAKTHTLITTEMPNHAHLYQTNVQHSDGQIVSTESLTSAIQVGGRRRYADTTAAVGGGGAHNNLQPYIVVAKWIRTA